MKVEILMSDIAKLAIKTRFDEGLVTTIQFDAKIQPTHIARILNLQRQGAPLLVTIGSPQAAMDLNIQEYRADTEAGTPPHVEIFSEGRSATLPGRAEEKKR